MTLLTTEKVTLDQDHKDYIKTLITDNNINPHGNLQELGEKVRFLLSTQQNEIARALLSNTQLGNDYTFGETIVAVVKN